MMPNATLEDEEEGPGRDSLYIVLPITIAYAVIFVSGVFGNVSTCIVISKNKYMHTATNYYLFSLAVSDLLLLVSGLPQEVYFLWFSTYAFGEAYCLLTGFLSETCANATVLTITAFTVERYVAICHPFLSHTVTKLSRAVKFVIAIWLLALCLAVPQAIQFGVIVYKKDVAFCGMKMNDTLLEHAFEVSTCVFFITPMTLITGLYLLIGFKLRKTRLVKRPSLSSMAERQNRGEKHVIRMLVAVVVGFFICWAPFHTQRLLAVYFKNLEMTPALEVAFKILYYTSGFLYYLSTTINPLLYNIMSHKFRSAFKDTFTGKSRQVMSRRSRRDTESSPISMTESYQLGSIVQNEH